MPSVYSIHCLAAYAGKKFPNTKPAEIVSGVLFLRFFTPPLLTADSCYGSMKKALLLDGPMTPLARRKAVLLAKLIQAVATGQGVGTKTPGILLELNNISSSFFLVSFPFISDLICTVCVM